MRVFLPPTPNAHVFCYVTTLFVWGCNDRRLCSPQRLYRVIRGTQHRIAPGRCVYEDTVNLCCMLYHSLCYTMFFLIPTTEVWRWDDTVGNPRRAQISQFELFELSLLTLDTHFSIEQFEPMISQSTVSSPLLRSPGQALSAFCCCVARHGLAQKECCFPHTPVRQNNHKPNEPTYNNTINKQRL